MSYGCERRRVESLWSLALRSLEDEDLRTFDWADNEKEWFCSDRELDNRVKDRT